MTAASKNLSDVYSLRPEVIAVVPMMMSLYGFTRLLAWAF